MDLDGDGIDDLISGSYTGGISFFKGLGKGKYAAETKLLPKNKDYESHELALSPCGGDWDGDGHVDMAIGQIDGPIRLMKNDGKGKFTRAGNFKSDGKEIEARDGGPCIVDWNGDGILDLLIGDDNGDVFFYPGKAKGSLDLGPAKPIIPRANADAWKPVPRDHKAPHGFAAKRPGVRTKPFAADWNGDGKLDLIVGDFIQIQAVPKTLTEAEKSRLAELKKEMEKVSDAVTAAYERVGAAALKEIGAKQGENLSPERRKKYMEVYDRLYEAEMEKMKPTMDKFQQLSDEIDKLERRPEATGFVWVYLRK